MYNEYTAGRINSGKRLSKTNHMVCNESSKHDKNLTKNKMFRYNISTIYHSDRDAVVVNPFKMTVVLTYDSRKL